MTWTPVPPEQRRPRNGRTIKEAAALTGLTEQTIKRWTSEPREVYLSKVARRREAIRALHAAEPSLSMRALGERLGCSAATVCRALKDEPTP